MHRALKAVWSRLRMEHRVGKAALLEPLELHFSLQLMDLLRQLVNPATMM